MTGRATDYRNPSVVDRIAKDNGIPAEMAERWFEEMLKFLAATTAARELGARSFHAVPSAAVDQAWHAFILHTRDYDAYCREAHGRFIHHAPRDRASEGEDDAWLDYLLGYAKTRALVEELFGPRDADIWPLP